MANDVAHFDDVFPACIAVLQKGLRPYHYRELTELALEHLGIPKDTVNWRRQIEDVREKLLEVGKYKSAKIGYSGEPFCVAYLRRWIPTQQFLMFNNGQPICITADFPQSENAAFEALMRLPYMQQKFPRADVRRRNRAAARGLLVQHHVQQWFKDQWPQFYEPPDNEGQWQRPCDHDFKLRLGSKAWKVDVAGPDRAGSYGLPNGKKPTDLHIFAHPNGSRLILDAFAPGKDFDNETQPFAQRPIEHLVVYLNCEALEIPYAILKDEAQQAIGGR